MGLRKHKTSNSADLVCRIDLYDFGTGDAMICKAGKQQHLVVLGGKSNAYVKAIDAEQGELKRRRTTIAELPIDEQTKLLAKRMSRVVVGAYIDVSEEEDDERIVQFDDISTLSRDDRSAARSELRSMFYDVTDLLTQVNDEVVKSSNFTPGRAMTLSAMLSSENGTEPSQNQTAQTQSAANEHG